MSSGRMGAAGCCCEEEGNFHGQLVPCDCFDDLAIIYFCGMPSEDRDTFCTTVVFFGSGCYDVLCDPPTPDPPPCQQGEVDWSNFGITASDIVPQGCSTEEDGCCYEKPPDDDCAIIDSSGCCPGGQQTHMISVDIDIKGGHSTSGHCVCDGGKEGGSPDCFGVATATLVRPGGPISQAPLCDQNDSMLLRCSRDQCGIQSAVPKPITKGVDCPTKGIPNCRAANLCCDPDQHGVPQCISNPYSVICSGNNGNIYDCFTDDVCPKGCSYWGVNHIGYKLKGSAQIPCVDASGGTSPGINYEGPGSLTVPGFDWAHLIGYQSTQSGIKDRNVVPPRCFFGGTPNPNFNRQSYSLGAVTTYKVDGIWRAAVSWNYSATPSDPCRATATIGATFSPNDSSLPSISFGSDHDNTSTESAGQHPCSGGVTFNGRFDWAQAVANGTNWTLGEAATLLRNCGPLLIPAGLSSGGGIPGGSGSIASEFFNEFGDNLGQGWGDGVPINGLRLDTFRLLVSGGFNVWGANPGSTVTESEGFQGCKPIAPCDICGSSIFEPNCRPSKAIIDHKIAFSAS